MRNKIVLLIFLFLCSISLFAQEASFDWKLHNVGAVKLVVTNTGGFNKNPEFDYKGLINLEHPANSGVEHITNAGLWIAAFSNGTYSLSQADGIGGSTREFYPSDEIWDTVWTVGRREVVDIPYWPGYTGIGDQDFVCRYSDDGPISQKILGHQPLGVEVIQVTHAWASKPLDEIIVVDYYVIPKESDLKDVYFGHYMNGNVGDITYGNYALDDQSQFIYGENIAMAEDLAGGGDGTNSAVGQKYFLPNVKDVNPAYVWWNGRQGQVPSDDLGKVNLLKERQDMPQNPQISTGDGTYSSATFGPVKKVAVGDTLKFTMAFVLGNNKSDIIKKSKDLEFIRAMNYKIPSPPPSPKVSVFSDEGEVRVSWKPQPGDPNNPEEFYDPDRPDGDTHPFEGYRIYKSTESEYGPWTLLAQFDKMNNLAPNSGIFHEYTDFGLLNNLEYYYTVTSYSRPDETIGFPELESSKNSNAILGVPGSPPQSDVSKVLVVPNPYRGDISYHSYQPAWEKVPAGRKWMEQDRKIQFTRIPAHCEIKIYTLAGEHVQTLEHNDPGRSYTNWNLTSYSGQAVASGIYVFTVENLDNGQSHIGKFVIIK
ncbi:MAG: hypothetical protein ACEPO8_08650 [Rhodothermaceae bacterium]